MSRPYTETEAQEGLMIEMGTLIGEWLSPDGEHTPREERRMFRDATRLYDRYWAWRRSKVRQRTEQEAA